MNRFLTVFSLFFIAASCTPIKNEVRFGSGYGSYDYGTGSGSYWSGSGYDYGSSGYGSYDYGTYFG